MPHSKLSRQDLFPSTWEQALSIIPRASAPLFPFSYAASSLPLSDRMWFFGVGRTKHGLRLLHRDLALTFARLFLASTSTFTQCDTSDLAYFPGRHLRPSTTETTPHRRRVQTLPTSKPRLVLSLSRYYPRVNVPNECTVTLSLLGKFHSANSRNIYSNTSYRLDSFPEVAFLCSPSRRIHNHTSTVFRAATTPYPKLVFVVGATDPPGTTGKILTPYSTVQSLQHSTILQAHTWRPLKPTTSSIAFLIRRVTVPLSHHSDFPQTIVNTS